jgi:hypothetical protein
MQVADPVFRRFTELIDLTVLVHGRYAGFDRLGAP